MSQVSTQAKPAEQQVKPEGSSCSMDKKAEDKGSCGTQHKQGSCSSKS